MKKVFISQPMKGKTDEEIKAEREKALVEVRDALDEEVEEVKSFFEDFPENPEGNVPLQYLAKSIHLLSTADAAYFASGYKDARGCKIEFECARAYGIPYLTYDGEKGNF